MLFSLLSPSGLPDISKEGLDSGPAHLGLCPTCWTSLLFLASSFQIISNHLMSFLLWTK